MGSRARLQVRCGAHAAAYLGDHGVMSIIANGLASVPTILYLLVLCLDAQWMRYGSLPSARFAVAVHFRRPVRPCSWLRRHGTRNALRPVNMRAVFEQKGNRSIRRAPRVATTSSRQLSGRLHLGSSPSSSADTPAVPRWAGV